MTTHNLTTCIEFYTNILQLSLNHFGNDRIAFQIDNQKINIHEYEKEIEPKAHLPVPGSLNICLTTRQTPETILNHLRKHGIQPLSGPVKRNGALGPIISIYLNDPDLNLIEIIRYMD